MGAQQHTYAIRTGSRPLGSGPYGTPAQVENLIAATQPEKITAAAQAYGAASSKLSEAQNSIYEAAKVLADYWSGPASDAAQKALQRLHATAGELAHRGNQMSKTLQWYGGAILPMYKNLEWPASATTEGGDQSGFDTAPIAAVAVMASLNQRIGQTWDGMPPQVEKNLPDLAERYSHVPTETGGGSAGGASTGGSPSGSGGAHLPNTPHPKSRGHDSSGWPTFPGGSPNSPPPGGSELAGITPGTGDPGNGGFGPGGSPFSPGGSGTGSPGLSGGGTGFGPGRALFGPAGAPGLGAGGTRSGVVPSEEPGLPRVGRGGESGVPVGSGGGRTDEKERERTTWLTEDRDIWTGDEAFSPGVIGDARNRFLDSQRDEDDILRPDELQEFLDLVDDEAGGTTGEDFSKTSDLDLTDDEVAEILDATPRQEGVEKEQPRFIVDEADFDDLGVDLADLLDIDDLGKRES